MDDAISITMNTANENKHRFNSLAITLFLLGFAAPPAFGQSFGLIGEDQLLEQARRSTEPAITGESVVPTPRPRPKTTPPSAPPSAPVNEAKPNQDENAAKERAEAKERGEAAKKAELDAFPKCEQNQYADSPATVGKMVERVLGFKSPFGRVLLEDIPYEGGRCRLTLLTGARLQMNTHCRINVTLPAKVCKTADNKLRAVLDNSAGWMGKKSYVVTISRVSDNKVYISGDSFKNTFTGVSAAEAAAAAR
ncbi:MAG: hypothetical protein HC902_04130 [Calothrix sp. SM1_5_4]|nr:hypothetical protein [Calothrix sp. SM1_5_4]